jgi:hypothetical protein
MKNIKDMVANTDDLVSLEPGEARLLAKYLDDLPPDTHRIVIRQHSLWTYATCINADGDILDERDITDY